MTAPGATERAAIIPSAAELVERLNTAWLNSRDLFADRAYAAWPAIRAFLLAAAPPREPTAAMLRAGMAVFHRDNHRGVIDFNEIWRAMYDAALGAGEGKQSNSAGAAGDGSVVAEDAGQSEPKPSVVARDKYRSGQEHTAADPSLIADIQEHITHLTPIAADNEDVARSIDLLQRARDALAEQADSIIRLKSGLLAEEEEHNASMERIAALERELAEAKKALELGRAQDKDQFIADADAAIDAARAGGQG